MIPNNSVERNAYIVGPHPRPFSRREKGGYPLALRERDGVRANHLPNLALRSICLKQPRFPE